MATCAYCGSELDNYDPLVLVQEVDGGRSEEGRFCNYGCLSAHIDEEGLIYGAACQC
jgi:hypothetical protein